MARCACGRQPTHPRTRVTLPAYPLSPNASKRGCAHCAHVRMRDGRDPKGIQRRDGTFGPPRRRRPMRCWARSVPALRTTCRGPEPVPMRSVRRNRRRAEGAPHPLHVAQRSSSVAPACRLRTQSPALALQLNQLLENRGLEEGDPVGDGSMPNLLHTPRHTKATEFGAHRTAVGSQCRTCDTAQQLSSAAPCSLRRAVLRRCARARVCARACVCVCACMRARTRVLF
jgi:hypothetical protein